MSAPLWWIRFRETASTQRFHAALGYKYGGYWTACARFIRHTGVLDIRTGEPPRLCACCRMRLKLPYLLPKSIDEVFGRETPAPVVLSDDDFMRGEK